MESLLGVPRGAGRVGDANDHAPDVEPPPSDLRDDQVRVVAAGGGQEHFGALDTRRNQGIHLERRTNREPSPCVFPGSRLVLVEAHVRERIGVEHGDLVAGGERLLGYPRPYAPGSHDQDEHSGRTLAFPT